ncbi:MAG TPA: AraC family transcriptional regulator [Roseiflexaceae bacterium]|nr:AraC family transcriptional regulator [Roseiflexaceae bacterium]
MTELELAVRDERPLDAYRAVVERVLQLMRARLHEPLALEDLAAEAHLSQFHFSRVFRQVTGSPPGEFLGALRLEAARRLLLTTGLSVTEVCYEVGYASLGTFTTRFTRQVGAPPAALRRLAAEFEPAQLEAIRRRAGQRRHQHAGATLSGRLEGVLPGRGTICAGLFPRAIPQGHPVACTHLAGPGPFRIEHVPDGDYYLLAAALPWSDDPLDYLAPGHGLLVAVGHTPLHVRGDAAVGPLQLTLRPPAPTDPPVVASLPFLLARWPAPCELEQMCEDRKIEEAPARPLW